MWVSSLDALGCLEMGGSDLMSLSLKPYRVVQFLPRTGANPLANDARPRLYRLHESDEHASAIVYQSNQKHSAPIST
eukprot:3270304-Prymnesium_polylepis.1